MAKRRTTPDTLTDHLDGPEPSQDPRQQPPEWDESTLTAATIGGQPVEPDGWLTFPGHHTDRIGKLLLPGFVAEGLVTIVAAVQGHEVVLDELAPTTRLGYVVGDRVADLQLPAGGASAFVRQAADQ